MNRKKWLKTRKERREIVLKESQLIRHLRNEAWLDQGGRCFYCNVNMIKNSNANHARNCTAEHLIPVSKGGKTQTNNIVAACFRCNNERASMPLKDFKLKLEKRKIEHDC